jgi:hypothetical protein
LWAGIRSVSKSKLFCGFFFLKETAKEAAAGSSWGERISPG